MGDPNPADGILLVLGRVGRIVIPSIIPDGNTKVRLTRGLQGIRLEEEETLVKSIVSDIPEIAGASVGFFFQERFAQPLPCLDGHIFPVPLVIIGKSTVRRDLKIH